MFKYRNDSAIMDNGAFDMFEDNFVIISFESYQYVISNITHIVLLIFWGITFYFKNLDVVNSYLLKHNYKCFQQFLILIYVFYYC